MLFSKRYEAIMRELANLEDEIRQKRCSEIFRGAPMNFGNLTEQIRASDYNLQMTTNNVKARLCYPEIYDDIYLATFAFSCHELSRLLESPEWSHLVRFLCREFGLHGENQYTRHVLQKLLSEPETQGRKTKE